MKPEQFIREYGVDKAREALSLCCWMDGSFCTRLWHGCVQNNHECCVDVKDLKRLVESLDLIKFYDGIERAKLKLVMGACLSGRPPHPREVELRRAIRDYESIYGGGGE
ncbi:hypothetical protein [Acinetobacter baumannii]|uniref:hypothetical protein n=1 Tax=Acinetobacter baumannii TaxID=470 RepID=UPI001CDD35CE|nr:hypothetical protein [Acinetobacter baumannii]MCA4434144.1 hypothetical protein [Acinetobacter baumannii]